MPLSLLVFLITISTIIFAIQEDYKAAYSNSFGEINDNDFITNTDPFAEINENDFILNGGTKSWGCHYVNLTVFDEMECICYGNSLSEIPNLEYSALDRISIIDAGVAVVRKDSFQPYKSTLKDILLSNLPHLILVEMGTFRNLKMLRTIVITLCPQLTHLDGMFDQFKSNKFKSLRVTHSGLRQIPDISPISYSEKIIHMLDLENNELTEIKSNGIKVNAEQVFLSYNHIETIQNFAFNGSQIGKLSLKGNYRLKHLPFKTFSGLINIRDLDLSSTEITYLPVDGLNTMEILRLENIPSLKVIPSVYDFKNLKEAWLTYSFHCCAFKYPERHNPMKHVNYQLYITYLEKNCSQKSSWIRKRSLNDNDEQQIFDIDEDSEWSPPLSNYTPNFPFDESSHESINIIDDSFGIFHESSKTLRNNTNFLCGRLSARIEVICFPEPDALNPCEDIMGSQWLRISVWFVVTTSIFGNLAVIIVMVSSASDLNVPKFLMCNLAVADLCMGLYLLLLAYMDLYSMGVYFNFAYDWQIGYGCQIAGFLTVFASQLSIFTLGLVTLERWFAITQALNLNRRIRLTMAVKLMVAGWCYCIIIASLPLFGLSNYSATSICLPMERNDLADIFYIAILLITIGFAFFLIAVCYVQIYYSINVGTRKSTSHHGVNMEMSVARKMALLVFTDFVCWAPIAFFSITALIGFPLIDVTQSKILLVFFYPLNACANPYLYAILTAQYKRDLFNLLARCGCCKKRAYQYKLTYSLPTNSNPIPLSARNSLPGGNNEAIITKTV